MASDEASDTGQRFALITDDAIAALRRLIGVPITATVEPWCYEVTRDNVRHYAHGIGDDNPLWCDPDYAAASSVGCLSAPPSFLFALDRVFSGYVGGLPGVHAMWSGSSTRWHRRMLVGQRIHTTAWLKDLVEHQTRFAGRAIQQIYHVEFRDQDDDLIADGDSWCFRTERDTARELGTKYDRTDEVPHYDADDLAGVARDYEGETVRGSEPRDGDDVVVGDELPLLTKGPMTVTGFIAFAQGWGGLYIRANRLAWKQLRNHPGLGIPDRFGVPDVPERVHWDDDLARAVGTPRAYDYGPERTSWLIQHLTDWMGDDGFLLRITGTVEAVSAAAEGVHVAISQRAVNQDGELSAIGHGALLLPRRP
jgi:acyl dehydratase